MPADASVTLDPALRQQFETYFASPQLSALERMKLFRLAWDLVGSEFAGRQQLYEKFYAGASFIVRNYSHTLAPWTELHGIVDDLMNGYEVPGS
jgi:4-hydroxyphenylacetate 3-monooxygenase